MNKDVIYIEPEEDITDVISKIKGAKEKIVAIVPPKKAGVFKSIVNIKLISKTAVNSGKSVVLVTTDASIIKLAAATKMPVTKDLKSAPAIPEPDDIEVDNTEEVDVDDEAEEEKEKAETETEDADEKGEEKEAEEDDEKAKKDVEEDNKNDDKDDGKAKEEDEKNDKAEKIAKEKPARKGNKLANSSNPVLRWIGTHQKLSIGIGVGLVAFIIIMVLATVVLPTATVTLDLKTVTGNFSENVTFTDKLADEKTEEGKFYIEELKAESKAEVEFEATGKKNVGEKASGTLTVYRIFKSAESVTVNAGSTFTYSNLTYAATSNVALAWGGKDSECKNKDDDNIGTKGCYIYKEVPVTAAEAGANYNISATGSGWTTKSGVTVASGTAMAGGTDKVMTIVQQSDVDKALNELNTESGNSSTLKDKLMDEVKEGQFAITSSFKQTASDPVSSPEVGKEIEDGKKAKLTVTTTGTMYVLDETKIKEFIAEKAKLDKGYKIYEMNDPFIDNFVKTDDGYIGKLKTSYVAGSTITEDDVINTVKGKGIGTAKKDLESNFDGIKTINITTSVPWVTSVPGDPNKITVNINTEE
ncbi:hypothetical protein IJI18_03580 [Candidatus Saccharibacteria bacterium]|nr:hypothetical protein [Candidatus Saccharibacteria bacterium]